MGVFVIKHRRDGWERHPATQAAGLLYSSARALREKREFTHISRYSVMIYRFAEGGFLVYRGRTSSVSVSMVSSTTGTHGSHSEVYVFFKSY